MSLQDAHSNADATVSAKFSNAVTPSDTVAITHTRALYVGAGGSVVVTDMQGNDSTYVGVLGGTILPIQVTKVKATGTTASNILALY